MTIASEAPSNAVGRRVPVVADPATALGADQRIILAESVEGTVLIVVGKNECRLDELSEKVVLIQTSAGPMLVIVDKDEDVFSPDFRDEAIPPSYDENNY